ncbi:LCP family protein [Priestia endophytica]|uniref:LCP family protein n=1 Tax=Priestia endophytica TaxID=135735 RepID=UPI003BF54D9C
MVYCTKELCTKRNYYLECKRCESMRQEARRQRRKNRKKRTRNFLRILLLLFLVVAGYSIYQYIQGFDRSDSNLDQFQDFKGADELPTRTNVLILGGDARGDETPRTDTIMIAHYNFDTNKAKVVSIMRDSYVKIPGHGKNKINAAYAIGGPELLRKTIKENFGVNVHYYAIVDFKGFPKIVDTIAPDGIEVDIPYEMSHGIHMTLKPGKQTLHGEELLGYVRFRHDAQSDFGRVKRQQEVIGKLKDQAVQVTNILKIPKLAGIVNSNLETNLGTGQLAWIAKEFLSSDNREVESFRLPIEDGFTEENLGGSIGAALVLDIDKNKEALQKFLDDENEKSSNQ